MSVLSKPYFHDEAAAFERLEQIVWPNGPTCPKCGATDRIGVLDGVKDKKGNARPGLKKCYHCRQQFTVRVATVFESSHVPLHKWFQAVYLMSASKKGVSSHQLHRILEVTYKTAWFMTHRIREAMTVINPGALGGQNKVVEVDETYVGGKSKNRKNKVPPKTPVVALVERDGEVRSRVVANVTGKSLKPLLDAGVAKTSYLMTDESPVYPKLGAAFAGHGTVNHSAEEYVRAGFWHTNTVEGYFSIVKRGIVGTFHHVSEKHLGRYLAEFDFRYNSRAAIGGDDQSRTVKALQGIVGKRLTYRRIDA